MDLIKSKGVIRPSEKAAEQWADLIDDLEKKDETTGQSRDNSEKPPKEQNLQQQS